MAGTSSNDHLGPDVVAKLAEVGELLGQARRRRRMSVSELARRLGVDRRTLSQLEAGRSTVAIGTFFAALDVLGLLRGVEEVVRPDNDLEAVRVEVRRARQSTERGPRIPDDMVDF